MDSLKAEDSADWFTSDDGTKLFLHRWARQNGGAEKPLAVLHIVHGMAEHSLRYEGLAKRLNGAGIEVWAADQRGHGRTADPAVNDSGKGGRSGHCADGNGFSRVTADVELINKAVRKQYPDIPLFVLGHSWGSFIVQNYIEQYSDSPTRINGCALSGTRGPDGLKIKAGLPLMSLLALLRGQRKGSRLAHAIADGPYNKPFRPNRTSFDWGSRDPAEVDAFVADPLCGKLCSTGFYRDLMRGLNLIHRADAMAKIRRDLPLYVFSGSADPVGEMGRSPTALVEAYRSIGIKDLEFVLYPDARHEPLNETNKDEVMGNLLSWIERHIAAK
jgi:alpha-beta hydrolase superfamily lysophospholipase